MFLDRLYGEAGSADLPSLALRQVELGLAWLDVEVAPEYRALQNALSKPRDSDRGVWALPNPQGPRGFRRTNQVFPASPSGAGQEEK